MKTWIVTLTKLHNGEKLDSLPIPAETKEEAIKLAAASAADIMYHGKGMQAALNMAAAVAANRITVSAREINPSDCDSDSTSVCE